MVVLLEKYILPILAGLTLLVLATNPMHFSWPQRIASLLASLLFAGLVSWDIHRRNSEKKKAASTEKVKEDQIFVPAEVKEDRIFVPVKPQDLMKIYKDLTAIQANKLAASYVDKWIQVSGIVSDIFPVFDGERVQVNLNLGINESALPYFSLTFQSKQWLEHLQILPRGHSITANGQIERIGSHGLTLGNCELVETQVFFPPPK